MMRIAEARRFLREAIGAGSWMRRFRNKEGRYTYRAGIGCVLYGYGCFSPEQCFAMASLNYDREQRHTEEIRKERMSQ